MALVGVQPISASGNSALNNGTFEDGAVIPACIPGVVSVGAVYDSAFGTVDDGCSEDPAGDEIPCWSQTSSYLELLAPGSLAEVSGIETEAQYGTSFAAPHVAGAWAVMSAAMPGASNSEILSALKETGTDILDSRVTTEERETPRIDLFAALDRDGDAVLFPFDACLEHDSAPPLDCDTDLDGYGNVCDCDLNQSDSCDTADIPLMKAALQNNGPEGDINCSGTTDTNDLPPFKALLIAPNRPGPSGLPCAGTVPCTP
jgi:hypothetical protein